MRHHGWISKELLDFLAHTPLRVLIGGQSRFHTVGAALLDARLFAFEDLLLIVLAVAAWKLRKHFIRPQYERRLWIFLFLLVFAGSAATYSLIAEPDTDTNFWGLAPYVAKLHGPVYTDRYTAFTLAFLSGYRETNVRSAGYLPDGQLRALLRQHRGCLLISQPQLERERSVSTESRNTSAVLRILKHPPTGWVVVKRVAATENPFESIVILCARSTPS